MSAVTTRPYYLTGKPRAVTPRIVPSRQTTMFCVSVFFSSRRRHTRLQGDWSSDVCSSDLLQTNSKAQVLPRDVLDLVPTAHTIQSVGQLVLGVQLTLPDVGGSQAMQQTYFTVHGAGTAQTSVLMDGMIINGLQGDGGIQSYLNDAGNEQMGYKTGVGSDDLPTRRHQMNLDSHTDGAP